MPMIRSVPREGEEGENVSCYIDKLYRPYHGMYNAGC